MILSNVNIGTGPSAGDGDPLRSAFTIINNNFQIIENNVNALTNSVNSVAGRTGNVILTVNDIVGLSNAYAISSATTTANTGMKGYVDQANSIQSGQVNAANLAIIAANLGMKGYVDSVAGSGSNYSNVNVKAYTETMGFQNFSNVNVAAYLTSQGVTGGSYSNVNAVSLITSLGLTNYSNVNVKAYTESMGFQNFGNANVAAYLTTNNYATKSTVANLTNGIYTVSLDTNGNVTLPGGATIGRTASNTAIFTASTGGVLEIKSSANNNKLQVDDAMVSVMAGDSHWHFDDNGKLTLPSGANITSYGAGVTTILDDNGVVIAQQVGSNAFSVTTATGVRVLAGGQIWTFNGNGSLSFPGGQIQTTAFNNTAPIITTLIANASTQSDLIIGINANVNQANLGMKGYVDSVASQSIYGNGNVKSYLTQFDGNIVPSANITYSLGSDTNRWKDLYLSGNTIFLGDTTISTSGGAVLTPVTRSLFSQSFLPGSTNSAATFTLDRLATAGSTRTVLVIGVQGGGIPPSPAPSYTLTEGVDFTISGLSLIITASYTATNISCTESYSDTGDLITATEVATDTITPGSGDLTVSGNVTVDGDLYVSPTSIYMGSLRISAADGNLKVNTGIKFSDNSVQSTAYSNVQVATYLPTYTGNIDANVAGFKIGYRDVPQVSAGNVTLALTDAGKHYYSSASAPTTLTIPSNANVAFTIGTAITIVNAGVGNISISKQVEAGLYLAGNATSATRTLTSYGMATLLKTATDQWFINGTGVV